MDMMEKVVTIIAIAMVVTGASAIPRRYNVTGMYRCQGRACDPHSHRALNEILKVTNARLWEGRNVWGCSYAFVQGGLHEAYHPPMKLIQISSECCDKCLSKCPKNRRVCNKRV